jgi:uncharacterized protein YjbI with pentapeptide repeats
VAAMNPKIIDDPLYKLLRAGEIEEFNQRCAEGERCDLIGMDLRGLDLRGIKAAGMDLTDCYFRQADLRGVDFSSTILEGVSLHGAKISGAYFPVELRPEEIKLSLGHGTRMRYLKK